MLLTVLVGAVLRDVAVVGDLDGRDSGFGIALGQGLLQEGLVDLQQVVLVVGELLELVQLRKMQDEVLLSKY